MARRPRINPADATLEERLRDSDDQGIVDFRAGTLTELDRMGSELQRMASEVEQLNALLKEYRSPLNALRHDDIIVVEVFLTLSSIWAAFTLWTNPTLFDLFRSSFHFASSIESNERAWALVAATAALLKIIGILSVCLMGLRSAVLRCARYGGLALSGMFWTIFGGSAVLGSSATTPTLFGFPCLLMGLFAWWSLLRLAK